jgi:hypothetical protein
VTRVARAPASTAARGEARLAGDPGGHDLGRHAAGADPGRRIGPAGHGLDPGVEVGDEGHVGGAGIGPRVRRVEAVDVRQEDEEVGADQLACAGRQPVVVAVADLLGDHRVVLVDHRHDAEVEEGLKGGPGVEPATPDLGVVAGQEDLGDRQAMGLQRRLPGVHEGRLAGGGGGLLLGQGEGLAVQAEAAAAQGHGARGHHQDLLAPGAQPREVCGEVGKPGAVRGAVGADDEGRADLDDHAAGGGEAAHGRQSPAVSPATFASARRART